jgi:hypothetical protein
VNEDEANTRPRFVFTNKQEFIVEVLAAETSQAVQPFGDVFSTLTVKSGQVDLRRISLANTEFHEQNVYIQALLPFFIEGASPLEVCPNWHYFLIYGHESGKLMALFTVYEAFLKVE